MSYQIKNISSAALIILAASNAHADDIIIHVTEQTSQMMDNISTKFVIGCVVLAIGIVATAIILKKK